MAGSGDCVNEIEAWKLPFWTVAPRRGRVSNFGGLPATGDQGGLPADSNAYGFEISGVDFWRNPPSALRYGIIAGYTANRPEAR
jgi:hypothetical protein